MPLTVKDVSKIEKLFAYKIENSLLRSDFNNFREEMRSDFSLLKELIMEMHYVVTTELPLLSKRVDKHEKDIIEFNKN